MRIRPGQKSYYLVLDGSQAANANTLEAVELEELLLYCCCRGFKTESDLRNMKTPSGERGPKHIHYVKPHLH